MRKLIVSGSGEFQGSSFVQVSNNIALGCISPEANDLLSRIMDEWQKHEEAMQSTMKDYQPSFYGFAYWLVCWSGLVQSAHCH